MRALELSNEWTRHTAKAPFGFDPKIQTPNGIARRARGADATNAESPYEFTRAWPRDDAPPIVAKRNGTVPLLGGAIQQPLGTLRPARRGQGQACSDSQHTMT